MIRLRALTPPVWLWLLMVVAGGGCKTKEQPPAAYEVPLSPPDSIPVFNIPVVSNDVIGNVLDQTPRLAVYDQKLRSFYARRSYQCAWFNEYGLTEQSGIVVNLVKEYIQSGIADTTLILPAVVDYYKTVNEPGFNPGDNDSTVVFADVLFTGQFLLFAESAWKGIGPDTMRQLEWFIPAKQLSAADYLDVILNAPSGRESPEEPVHIQYLRLKEKVKIYNTIAHNGDWPQIPLLTDTIWPGDSSEIITHIRRRLVVSGDFTGDTTSAIFDEDLALVIIQVRESFGLSPEKRIDRSLVSLLNVPARSRLRQMMVNLERWKWLPGKQPSDLIVVNIPDFKLHVFEKGQLIKSMKVIVGTAATKTVIFSGELSEVVFSPYWVIPASILQNEILPAIKRNPSYLHSHNMEVVSSSSPHVKISPSSVSWGKYNGYNFPYTIRQKPGPSNSLGRVKFLFPNEYSIYLHDTPAERLFEAKKRMFSHGCIRVAEPEWLSVYLLKNDTTWNVARIREAMNGNIESRVRLQNPVPVRITYFTCWVDAVGRIHFRDDVYHHDKKLEKLILKAP